MTLLLALLAVPAGAQSAACSVDYAAPNQWPGGFTANVTIHNDGSSAISGWTLTWQFPDGQTISQAWNSSVNNAGPAASVSNASWNATIPAGGSVSFGFNGSWDNTSNDPPTAFTLNGAICGGDTGEPSEEPTGPSEEPTGPSEEPTGPSEVPTGPSGGSLREAAQAAGVDIGVAVATGPLASDAAYQAIVAEQFSSLTPENAMKFDATEPQQGVFDFTGGDAIVAFAQANDQVVRGHTLVWHSQNPSWLTGGSFTAAQIEAIMVDHITAVVGHYQGQLVAWDVANEIFNDDGTWRDTIWYQAMGPDYVSIALEAARAADPDVALYLNDYNIDGLSAKSDAYYQLAQQLLADGVPLDGIGLQGHLQTTWFPSGMTDNIARFAELGLEVALTEVDIRMPLPVTDAQLATQAEHYTATVEACLAVDGCVSYTVWGVTDAFSWVPSVFSGEGAPLLYDEDYQPKPAYDAVLTALQNAA